MNRPTSPPSKPDQVVFAWAERLRLWSIVVVVVGSVWHFTMDISGELRETRTEVRATRELLERFEKRLERLEDRQR